MFMGVLGCFGNSALSNKVLETIKLYRKQLLMTFPTVESCCGALRLRVAAVLIGFLNMLLDVALITGIIHLMHHPDSIAIHSPSGGEATILKFRIYSWALLTLVNAMFGVLSDVILLNAACAWQASGAFVWSGVAVVRFFAEGALASLLLVRCALSGGGCAPFAAAALARIIIDGLNLYFALVTYSLGQKFREIGLQEMDPFRVINKKEKGEKIVDVSGV